MFISESNLAALIGSSSAVTKSWAKKGLYPSCINNQGISGFEMNDLLDIPEVRSMVENHWDEEFGVKPMRDFTSVELFAGAGGLALGMAKAGFHHVMLNEFDSDACKTLRNNRPDWNVVEGDVRHIDFSPLKREVDFLSGGFPCQAFSYAGKQNGFNDTRGTLFFELARAVTEIQPKVFMGENVKGLSSHDNGRTFETIKNAIAELGYTLVEPRVLKAIMYQVPQKRERLILIAIRNDIKDLIQFHWPSPFERVLTLRDALFQGILYDHDVPDSEGAAYPLKKQKVLELVPQGGDWRDLPKDVAREYMGGSWLLEGGKTGMARRLSLDEPSLTLTCSPCQKQTERCHPLETRPLSIREYARIQTFPDEWQFAGSVASQYKQIGNAVPVNLAWAIGRSLIRLFNDIQQVMPSTTIDCSTAVETIMREQSKLVVVKDNNTQTSEIKDSYGQLNLFDLFDQYAYGNIVENSCVHEENASLAASSSVDLYKNVLVSLVKKDNLAQYLDKSAKIYYTGKKFPATVELNKLYYFMPYVKNKGVKDLYLIKKARIGTKKEVHPECDDKDFRLVFEIEFVKELFDDYQPIELKIWRSFTDTTIQSLLN